MGIAWSSEVGVDGAPPRSLNSHASLGSVPPMKNIYDYQKHAQECRKLAQQMPLGEQQEQLLEMARTWEGLASSREGMLRSRSGLDVKNASNSQKATPKG